MAPQQLGAVGPDVRLSAREEGNPAGSSLQGDVEHGLRAGRGRWNLLGFPFAGCSTAAARQRKCGAAEGHQRKELLSAQPVRRPVHPSRRYAPNASQRIRACAEPAYGVLTGLVTFPWVGVWLERSARSPNF